MTSEKHLIYCDGGARSNPGPAGAGFIIREADDEVLAGGAYLGQTTNNVAEYCGFIWALENAEHLGANHVVVHADSSLMVNQLQGSYKVKDQKLKWLHNRARELVNVFESCEIIHIPREDNARADELANEAMDAQDAIGTFEVSPSGVRLLVSDVGGNLFNTEEEEEEAEPTTGKKGIYSLQIKWHFDAAHRLYDYPGECAELHGHTWEVEVTVESDKLNDIEIVYDFKDLKRDLAAIVDAYDHKLINDVAPFDEISPTAENLARIIYEQLTEVLADRVKVTEVGVWESPVARIGYRLE
ncbi:MAG: 6-carboxytetrahydropterin synthase QueD [Actinomycetia bacterium]|nr:6-carboxytetrahydropterin synthase QueD [Actinomycetes bacterium]